MLSIENPPPDPPCPCQFLQLKSGSDEIERPPHKLPLPEVDLLKQPSLDHHHHNHHHTPLPKFSIRNYVFTARSKDIKTNWPFSPKNLQLCLKHGLKDPLPPFQPLDTVRNQSLKRCTVETNPFEKQNTREFDEEPSGSNDDVVLELSNDAHSNHDIAGTCIDNSSCRSGGEHENDLPSTTTSACQSEIDSVLVNKQSNLPLETDTSVEASAEVQATGPFKSQKTENTTRPSGKKCRLIVKFGPHSDRSSTEDIASNCTTVSESMASKVCPVCKTFSSSSNTTLNAHIDQCLSVESTPKWTADSKLTRNRIKPRKTRLMVDVYATAKPCTLEELDRRNGTSWATASNIPRQDSERLEISDEGKKQRVSPIHPEDTGDVGAVYIDANGTKLRILSKFNDVPPVSKVGEDLGPHKSLKGGKGSKFFSTKKKRRHAPKHHKYLKLAPQSRKIFSHKTRSSTIVGGEEGYCGVEESCRSEGPQVTKQIKSSDSRNLRQRVCSKRAGLSRKPNAQARQQPLICKWHVTRDLRGQSDQSHQGDHVVERNCVRKFKISSENPISSPEKCETIEKPVYEAPVIDKRERSFGRKRVRSPLFGARICNNVERSLLPLKQNGNQLSKDHPFVHEDHMVRSLNSGGNCISSLSKKMVDIDANSNPETPVTATTTISQHSFAFKCFRSSPKKNVLAASNRSSMVESRSNLVEKYSTRESQLHFMAEIDEGAMAWCPEVDQECDLVHDGANDQCGGKEITEELSFGGSSVQGTGEQRGRVSISGREITMPLKSIQSAPYCYDHDERENTDSSARGNEDILDKVDGLESVEETVTSLSQSVETKFNKLSNPSKNRSNSLQSIEDYSGPLCGGQGLPDPTRPSLVDKPNMFCAEVDHGIIGQTSNMGGELDSDAAQGNSFPEVDPIPIPGPPGSFLPSPRDMGSDDFQGNSSLTTSRIQSSQDQLDLVDGDSSDSPISAVSTISNSAEARSDLKYAEPSAFIGPPATLERDRSGYSTAKPEPLVENGAAVPQTSMGPERTFEGEKFRVHRISMEKRPLIFKNDDQPCCCQRKERSSQSFSLNYQESQLLRRRTMASMMVPATGMQIGTNPNIRHNNLDARPETFSLSSGANLGSEQMVLPTVKTPAGPIPFKGCPDAGVKLSSRSDCDSASPSSSNPILRLMGKNLMVVNKEEDASVPLGQAQSCAQSNCLTPNFPTSSGISSSNIRNQGGLSFHHTMPQGSLIFDQNPNDLVGQSFDVRLTNGYRNRASLATPQTPLQFPAGMVLDEHMDCGFTASMELYKYEGNCNLPTRPNRPKNKLGPAATYDMEKVTTLDCRQRYGDSAVSSKEVIVIDDAPETETNKTADIAKHSEGLRESQLISYGISMPLVPNHIVRHKNPFSRYQSEDSPLIGDPTVVHNNNFHTIPSRRANTSPVRWDCTSEGSGMLQRGPFMAASPSTSHLRSALYYSPSLS
ncbi:Uncharacterized protein TCM_030507 isoform 1 [Theobroma cacao]|uniref:Uncharacterized protein isoform 1 n=1 Tax=Theobroma cacao TaxID=3641 RepID=A0A061F3D0_THECC|nr:Uncharacterized protein TCM_030507 isoform 1 [Theobroma cacao]EOY11836.1 Uncharacterized protein TCM_030507 isoform 1 [Theobroma cacao]